MFGISDWNLRHAHSETLYVQTQATSAGLVLANAQVGLDRNAARFRDTAVPIAPGTTFVARPEPGRMASPNAAAGSRSPEIDVAVEDLESVATRMASMIALLRTADDKRQLFASETRNLLVRAFFQSDDPQNLAFMTRLEEAFIRHIEHHMARANLIGDVAHTRHIPDDIAYPRYFEDAEQGLLAECRLALVILNQGNEFSLNWAGCLLEIISYLKSFYAQGIGINYDYVGGPVRAKLALSIALEVYQYTSLQLLSLLIQIRDGSADQRLVEQLRRARDGRYIELDDAITAGVRSEDILKASRLAGNIDIAHANRAVMTDLYMREHPGMSKDAAWKVVRGQIAQLGLVTGQSRFEYDGLIAGLKSSE